MTLPMHGATIEAAATLLLAAALAVYVALRPARSGLRGWLLGVLGALAVWSTGVIWRFTAADDASAFRGYLFGWLGIVSVAPLWLMLAAAYARLPLLEDRPRLALAAFAPSVLAWAALATNESHHLFLLEFSREHVVRGPLFYAWLLFSYPCILGGVALFLHAVRRSSARGGAQRFALIALCSLVPASASLAFVFGWLPLRYDPTPVVLGVSVFALTLGIFRLRLLDAVPLARRDVVDHLRDGVLIADAAGGVLDANPAALAVLGQPLARLRGHPLGEVVATLSVDPDAAEALRRELDALGPDRAVPPAELAAPGGRWIEITASCLRAADGVVLGRFVVLRDRTEERRYERLLRQSQRLETVGSLAAGVAHEVNNPLAFVRANLAQLERLAEQIAKRMPLAPDDPDAEEIDELPQIVAECLDGIDRIARIVDAMRRFSRTPTEERGPVHLNRVVQEAIRLAELHRNRRVRVEAWLAEDLPAVHGSAQRLTQVFLNLLVNAKQALADRADGCITVHTCALGDFVEVMMSDDGPGVPEGIRDRIFDPFFTTKGPDEGTGLGLAIAYDIVREHGGLIELRGGGGACFVVRLPLASDADALLAPP